MLGNGPEEYHMRDMIDEYNSTGDPNLGGAIQPGSHELPPENHPLRRLGIRLSELLDEDQWQECEQLLLEAWQHKRRTP